MALALGSRHTTSSSAPSPLGSFPQPQLSCLWNGTPITPHGRVEDSATSERVTSHPAHPTPTGRSPVPAPAAFACPAVPGRALSPCCSLGGIFLLALLPEPPTGPLPAVRQASDRMWSPQSHPPAQRCRPPPMSSHPRAHWCPRSRHLPKQGRTLPVSVLLHRGPENAARHGAGPHRAARRWRSEGLVCHVRPRRAPHAPRWPWKLAP